MRIILDVGMEDVDGNAYPHPSRWNWEELVGNCTYVGEAE